MLAEGSPGGECPEDVRRTEPARACGVMPGTNQLITTQWRCNEGAAVGI